jgi:Ulp1 family protease
MNELAQMYYKKLLKVGPPDFKSYHIRSIIFPVNIDNQHWVMYMADTKMYTIDYYDPLHGCNSDSTVPVTNSEVKVIQDIVTCLFCEGDKDKFKYLWRIRKFPCDRYLPIQKDQYNCSMYICLVAYYKVHDMKFENQDVYEKKLKNIDHLRLEFLALIMTRSAEIGSDNFDDTYNSDEVQFLEVKRYTTQSMIKKLM